MASPSNEIRQHFAHHFVDGDVEEFLCWVADLDARIRQIAPELSIMEVTDIGWSSMWYGGLSIAIAIEELVAFDFEFETAWELWKEQQT